MYSGYTIPPYYDSMIAKVIVHGENRFEALMKMQRALAELVTEGVVTNAEFQMDLIGHPKVIAGDYNTATFYKRNSCQTGRLNNREGREWLYLKRRITFASILIAARHLPMNQQCPTIFGRNVPAVNGPYIQKEMGAEKSLSSLWL